MHAYHSTAGYVYFSGNDPLLRYIYRLGLSNVSLRLSRFSNTIIYSVALQTGIFSNSLPKYEEYKFTYTA